jgi:hypothetical protein
LRIELVVADPLKTVMPAARGGGNFFDSFSFSADFDCQAANASYAPADGFTENSITPT